jgi:hypothetical protein
MWLNFFLCSQSCVGEWFKDLRDTSAKSPVRSPCPSPPKEHKRKHAEAESSTLKQGIHTNSSSKRGKGISRNSKKENDSSASSSRNSVGCSSTAIAEAVVATGETAAAVAAAAAAAAAAGDEAGANIVAKSPIESPTRKFSLSLPLPPGTYQQNFD